MPGLTADRIALYRRYKDQGFTVLAVSIDTADAATVSRFVKNLSLTFPIGLDPKMDVANRYTVRDGTAARAVVEGLLK